MPSSSISSVDSETPHLLKSVGCKAVAVQVSPWALFCKQKQKSAEDITYLAFSRPRIFSGSRPVVRFGA
ncbi:MAG: hypothetical protein VX153_03415 [Verrucomicrobiota bacterium]|nr:hypothetical protein [Verrucomicrobiota bacterium]